MKTPKKFLKTQVRTLLCPSRRRYFDFLQILDFMPDELIVLLIPIVLSGV